MLFDNNVPVPLRRHLGNHEVTTAREMGWQELENGDLLKAAEAAGFETLVTSDQNLSYQQNLTERKLALVVLGTNNWSIIESAPELAARAIDAATSGSFQSVPFEARRRRGVSRKPES